MPSPNSPCFHLQSHVCPTNVFVTYAIVNAGIVSETFNSTKKNGACIVTMPELCEIIRNARPQQVMRTDPSPAHEDVSQRYDLIH